MERSRSFRDGITLFLSFVPMLKDRLYRITAQEETERGVSFSIALDPKDPIFQGHFPDQPVLPAACMMEMGRELLGECCGGSFDLAYARNMKIPSVIDPRHTPELSIELSYKEDAEGTLQVKYNISGGGTVFFKFSGAFRR